MSRPHLVVGLGGTGQIVLTYLKKNLLGSYNNSIPDNISLVAFDLVDESIRMPFEKKESQIPEIDNISEAKLDPNELYFIGGRLKNIAGDISRNRYPELNWFAADEFLRNLPQSILDGQQGSGSIRQLGRLAFYNDIRNDVNSIVLNVIRKELTELMQNTGNSKPVTVSVISSMYGGTGSGLLVNTVQLIRSQFAILNINGIINGILLLPDKSGSIESGGKEALARCFSTWRELDRFMTVGVRNKRSSPRNIQQFSSIDSSEYRLFDGVYLVDELDKQGPSHKTKKCIADFLVAIQDESASNIFNQILANSGNFLSRNPEAAFYSSFGVSTIKSYAKNERELAAHRISQQVITILLDPISEKDKYGYYQHSNREIPYSDIQTDVRRFLSSSYFTYGEEQVVNAQFLNLIARLEQETGDPNFLHKINTSTRKGLLSDFDTVLLNDFTDVFRQVQDEAAIQKVRDIPWNISKTVSNDKSFGNTPRQRYDKQIHEKATFERRFFGKESIESPQLGGEFYQLLLQAKEYQIESFNRVMSSFFIRVLNGQDLNPIISKGGKIFYSLQFIEKLFDDITRFSRILESELKSVDENRFEVEALSRVKDAHEQYTQVRYKRAYYAFWNGFTDPIAEKAEKEYILSLQIYWSLRIRRILLLIVLQTTIDMKNYVNKIRSEFLLWLDILKGMSVFIDKNIKILEREFDSEKDNINRRRILTSPLPDLSQYTGELLSEFVWKLDADRNQLSLGCQIKLEHEPSSTKTLSKDKATAIQNNYHDIIGESRKCLEDEFINRSAAHDIEISMDPRILAETLLRQTEPFYHLTPISRGPAARYNIICIKEDISGNNRDYLHQLISEIRNWDPRVNEVYYVNLEDPYSLTFLTLDSLILGSDFDTYQACRQAYIEILHLSDKFKPRAHLYQVFSAEINALEFEASLQTDLHKPIRTFSPEVVALLDDKRAIRLFFNAILFGIIRFQQDRLFFYPEDEGISYNLSEGNLNSPKNNEFDLYEIMSRFTSQDFSFINIDQLEERIRSKRKQYHEGEFRPDNLENIRALLRLILSKATEQSASAKWVDLLDLSIIILRQSSEFFNWKELSQLTDVAYNEGIYGIERLRERTHVSYFFEKAGFAIQEDSFGDNWFIGKAQNEYWKAKIGNSVFIYLNKGKVLDHGDVRKIYDLSSSLKIKNNTIFVVVDQTPADSAWLEIATIRTDGIRIIPIDDSVINMGQEAQNERIELDKALSRFIDDDLDLFSVRHPIADRLNFFGREAFASKIIKQMEHGKPVGLFGLRKIGKSSLLYYIRNQAPFPVAYIDLQKGWELLDLYNRVLLSLRQSLRVKQPNVDWEALAIVNQDDPSSEFIARINDLQRVLSRRNIFTRLGLIVDEIELLTPSTAESQERYLNLSRTLRGLVQEDGNLSIVIAGVSSSIVSLNRLGDNQNPFYQFFEITYLGPLSQEDTVQMIRNIGQQMGLRFSNQAANFAAAISGGHPFLARQLCSLAIHSVPAINMSGEIELDHLKQAAQVFIQNPDYAANLDDQGLWGEVTNSKIWSLGEIQDHSFILEQLAESQPAPNSVFLQTTLDLSTRERAIYNLTSRSVISNFNKMLSLRFDLFRNWIRRYRLKIVEDL